MFWNSSALAPSSAAADGRIGVASFMVSSRMRGGFAWYFGYRVRSCHATPKVLWLISAGQDKKKRFIKGEKGREKNRNLDCSAWREHIGGKCGECSGPDLDQRRYQARRQDCQ